MRFLEDLMLVLGIETSCDETAAALVTELGEVRSDVIHSQIAAHRPYGGVVPEIASRNHLQHSSQVIEAALQGAGSRREQVDAIAVTCRPGLSGALLVGVQVARGLAWAMNLPVVGVDHLLGHMLAARLNYTHEPLGEIPNPPFVALLVSGGHTALYRVDDLDLSRVVELGATRDDAAGEAFDKVAKWLGLGYPGGPVIERLAAEGDPTAIDLTLPMPNRQSLEFSFSGIKTQVLRWVDAHGPLSNEQRLRDLCAAFQDRVVQSLTQKTVRAAQREGLKTVVLGGGVASNSHLRRSLHQAAAAHGLRLFIPSPRACTDNAAMIAYAGALRLARGEDDRESLTIHPHSALLSVTRKGRGRRRPHPPGHETNG